jgi:Immunity protein Imm1
MEEENDPGFNSTNPDYAGPEDEMIPFVLASGQRDEYPASSVVPLGEAVRAAEHFVETFEPAPFILWDLE